MVHLSIFSKATKLSKHQQGGQVCLISHLQTRELFLAYSELEHQLARVRPGMSRGPFIVSSLLLRIWYRHAWQILFTPYCGQSYMPTRSVATARRTPRARYGPAWSAQFVLFVVFSVF
jgi:hypothetical protein